MRNTSDSRTGNDTKWRKCTNHCSCGENRQCFLHVGSQLCPQTVFSSSIMLKLKVFTVTVTIKVLPVVSPQEITSSSFSPAPLLLQMKPQVKALVLFKYNFTRGVAPLLPEQNGLSIYCFLFFCWLRVSSYSQYCSTVLYFTFPPWAESQINNYRLKLFLLLFSQKDIMSSSFSPVLHPLLLDPQVMFFLSLSIGGAPISTHLLIWF